MAARCRRDPTERIRDALQHSDTMRALALAGLRARFPHLENRELLFRLLEDSSAGLVRPPKGP
jgi:hypothetical protein